jgi:hypothetical protein
MFSVGYNSIHAQFVTSIYYYLVSFISTDFVVQFQYDIILHNVKNCAHKNTISIYHLIGLTLADGNQKENISFTPFGSLS